MVMASVKTEPAATVADLARRHDLGGGAMEWEYLPLTATRTAESPFS